MKQFFVFIRKEFYHVSRDRKTLLMLVGLPVVLIILFGFALTNEIKNSKIAICDYARDEASQQIIDKITASNYFDIDRVILNHEQIYSAFKAGKIKLAVVFPANFNSDLSHLNKAQIQIIADASDPNTATILTSYITSIISDYQLQLQQNSAPQMQILPEIKMLYNPELQGATNFVPGLGLFILTALSLGLLISNITSSQQTAMLISLLGMLLPTMMFTGFLFPLENMPRPLQFIANVVPAEWYYIIAKSIIVKGLGFSSIWKETLILAGTTTFLLAVSFKKFKIRLA